MRNVNRESTRKSKLKPWYWGVGGASVLATGALVILVVFIGHDQRPSQREQVVYTAKVASALFEAKIFSDENQAALVDLVENVTPSYTITLSPPRAPGNNVMASVLFLTDYDGRRLVIVQGQFGQERGWLVSESVRVPMPLSSSEVRSLTESYSQSARYHVIVESARSRR